MDYAPLHDALMLAYEQATSGKGHERHANGKDYLQQPMMVDGSHFGLGSFLFQVVKKSKETPKILDLHGTQAAIRELCGAINYAASAIIHLQRVEQQEKAKLDATLEAFDQAVERAGGWTPPTPEERDAYIRSLNQLHTVREDGEVSGVWLRESPGATGEGTRNDTFQKVCPECLVPPDLCNHDDEWDGSNIPITPEGHQYVPARGAICDDPCSLMVCVKCVARPETGMTPYQPHPPGWPYKPGQSPDPCSESRQCSHGPTDGR